MSAWGELIVLASFHYNPTSLKGSRYIYIIRRFYASWGDVGLSLFMCLFVFLYTSTFSSVQGTVIIFECIYMCTYTYIPGIRHFQMTSPLTNVWPQMTPVGHSVWKTHFDGFAIHTYYFCSYFCQLIVMEIKYTDFSLNV